MTPPANPRALHVEDRERQAFVTLALIFCLVAALVGLGLLGVPVDQVGGGVFAPDSTLLAPAQWSVLVWRAFYLGFVAYTVWQWLPAQRVNPVNRTVGWYAGWSMIIAGGWIMITQHGWLWAGVLLLFGMTISLARLMDAVTAPDAPRRRGVAWLCVDATFGVCLGWTAVAAIAMVAATLRSVHIGFGSLETVIGLGVLALGAMVALRVAFRTGGSIPAAFGFAWGFAGIAWARLFGQPRSVAIGAGALVAIGLVALGTWQARRMGAVTGVRAASSPDGAR